MNTRDAQAIAAPEDTQAPSGKAALWRVGALAALLLGAWAVASATGLDQHLTTDAVRAAVAEAGFWGIPIYLGLAVLGALIQIPGMVFIAAAIVAFGQIQGSALGMIGALLAISTSFLVVRGVGGKPLGAIRSERARKLLAGLDRRPIRTTALLRLFFFLSPPLTYALALSNIRFRDYFLGSLLGLVAPLAVVTSLFNVCFI